MPEWPYNLLLSLSLYTFSILLTYLSLCLLAILLPLSSLSLYCLPFYLSLVFSPTSLLSMYLMSRVGRRKAVHVMTVA
jgi:hypothetical protein